MQLFGLLCSLFGVSGHRVQVVFLTQQLKNLLSAAVRMSAVGPLQAQRLLCLLSKDMLHDEQQPPQHPHSGDAPVLTKSMSPQPAAVGWALPYLNAPLSSITSRSPLVEVLQTSHDRLWMRLFNT